MIDVFKTGFGPVPPVALAVIVLTCALALIWLGVSRMGHPGRYLIGAVASGLIVLWFSCMLFLAQAGVFTLTPDVLVPAIPFAIALPVLSAIFAFNRWPAASALVDAVPISTLTLVQLYRIGGAVFIGLWAAGRLPAAFAVPAGFGDILVGVMAVRASFAARGGQSHQLAVVTSWNYSGIADFAVALAMGFMISPGPLNFISSDHPNTLVSSYPLVMIPVFAVPLSLILHAAGLIKLGRMKQGSNCQKIGAEDATQAT